MHFVMSTSTPSRRPAPRGRRRARRWCRARPTAVVAPTALTLKKVLRARAMSLIRPARRRTVGQMPGAARATSSATSASPSSESGSARIIAAPPLVARAGGSGGRRRSAVSGSALRPAMASWNSGQPWNSPRHGSAVSDAIERQHLLHGVGIAEEHDDFLQVRACHVASPVQRLNGNARARRARDAVERARNSRVRRRPLRKIHDALRRRARRRRWLLT